MKYMKKDTCKSHVGKSMHYTDCVMLGTLFMEHCEYNYMELKSYR